MRGRTDGIRNSAPCKLGNGSANSVGDLIIVDLPRYHAEKRIAIQKIHQKFYVRMLRNFSAIFGCLKGNGGNSLDVSEKTPPAKNAPLLFRGSFRIE